MGRRVSLALFVALATAGFAAGLFVPRGGASSQATIRVGVSVTGSTLALSTRSVPVGTVLFTVTNRGKVANAFIIAGSRTPVIAPGHRALLQVRFSKTGNYPYRTASGSKGVFSVRAAAVTTAPVATTLGTANTRVVVEIYDPPTEFILAPPRFPSGNVTFVITNHCVMLPNVCSFDLEGIHAGAHLNGGESETWTVALPPGVYHYHCDLAPGLMYGQFTVTP